MDLEVEMPVGPTTAPDNRRVATVSLKDSIRFVYIGSSLCSVAGFMLGAIGANASLSRSCSGMQ
jgi:hypothetical protein